MFRIRRFVAPLRLAGARLASRRGRVALAALGAAAGAALLATTLGAGLTVADRTMARSTADLAGPARAVTAVWGGLPAQQPASWSRLDRMASRSLTPITGKDPSPFMLFRETRIGGALVDLAAGNDLGRWVKLESGRLPGPCTAERCEVVQLAGSGPLPNRPGLRLIRVGRGSLVSEAPFGDLVGAETAGSIVSAAERFHRPAAPPFVLAKGVGRLAAVAPLSYVYRSYVWVVPLRAGDVHPWSLDRFSRRLAQARAELGVGRWPFAIQAPETQLDEALRTGRAGERRLLLLGGEAAALLLAFTILAASGLRRDAEANRRRLTWLGATRGQLVLESGAEAAVIAALGAAAGWFAGAVPALAIARHFGSPGGAILAHSLLSPEGIAVALGLAVAAALILLGSIWARPLRFGGLVLSPLDVAAVGAAVAIAVAFARGATDTSGLAGGHGTGVVLLLLPGLVVFVAAVVAARALGLLPRLFERAARGGALSLRLALLSLARNPGRAAIAVAFLVVSLGLALFAASYRATLARGQHDQAEFAVPAAAIVSEDYSKLVPVLEAAPFRTYRRAGPAAQVIRLSGNVPGGQAFTLLGMPAGAVDRVRGWRSDFSPDSLAGLGRRIAPSGSVALRGVLVPPGRLTLPVSATGVVRIRAVVETPRGAFRFVRIPGRTAAGRLLGFTFDLTNRGIERQALSGEGAHPVSQLTLRLGRPRVGSRPLPVDYRAWTATGGAGAATRRTSATLRFLATSELQTGFRLRQPLDGKAVPVVASPNVAAAASHGLLPVEVEGTPVLTRVVGTATSFPSVEGDFVLADRQTLATAMNADSPGTAVTNEVWLGAEPPHGPPFDVLRVRTERAELDRLADDPLARGSLLALVVAAAAGLALALGGLLLVVVADLRDERGELFDLEAQGATPATLRGHLRLRTMLVVALGLVGGIATGAALSALAVRLVKVTANATEAQPPLVLSVDWVWMAVGLVGFVAVAVALVAAATWHAFRAEAPGRFAEAGW